MAACCCAWEGGAALHIVAVVHGALATYQSVDPSAHEEGAVARNAVAWRSAACEEACCTY